MESAGGTTLFGLRVVALNACDLHLLLCVCCVHTGPLARVLRGGVSMQDAKEVCILHCVHRFFARVLQAGSMHTRARA